MRDVEECIVRAGGVSKFQYIAFTLIVCGMISGAFILYSIQYFTHVPPLFCQKTKGGEYASCDAKEACDKDKTYHWKIDVDSDENLKNWTSELDLYCNSSFEFSLVGSMFFVGTFIGSFVLPRAADIYGRKPLFLVGLTLYIAVVITLFFNRSLSFLYVLMFLGGVAETGRYYVAYVYCVEMMPQQVQDATGIYIFTVFGFVMTYIALQFWFITNDVYVNNYIALSLAVISWITVFVWLPESPRFFYGRKQFQKSRDIILKMARVNGTDHLFNQNFVFEAEEEDSNGESDS